MAGKIPAPSRWEVAGIIYRFDLTTTYPTLCTLWMRNTHGSNNDITNIDLAGFIFVSALEVEQGSRG